MVAVGAVRVTVGVLNLVLFLIAVGLAIMAGVVMWGGNLSDLIPVTSTTKTTKTTNKNNGTGVANVEVKGDGNEEIADAIQKIVKPLATGGFVVGLVLAQVALCGLCGACCEVQWMLIMYMIFLGLMIVIMIGVTIFFFALEDTMETLTKTLLLGLIEDGYTGDSDPQGHNLLWQYLHITHQCCGVNDYTDFEMSTTWERKWPEDYVIRARIRARVGNGTSLSPSITTPTTTASAVKNATQKLEHPVSCCKELTQDDFKPGQIGNINASCARSPNDENSNYKTGCSKPFLEFLRGPATIILAFFIGIILLLILLILLSIVMYRDTRAKEVKEENTNIMVQTVQSAAGQGAAGQGSVAHSSIQKGASAADSNLNIMKGNPSKAGSIANSKNSKKISGKTSNTVAPLQSVGAPLQSVGDVSAVS